MDRAIPKPGAVDYNCPVVCELQEALTRAATLREQNQRHRQESVALRALLRKQRLESRTLTWRVRECRANVTYSKLLARVRLPETARTAPVLEERRRLSERIRGLEARISGLIADRDAFFDAFERYLAIERSRS